ncbi:fidgetin-like protein 1 isoform X2 [Sitodiplosis mosellana]|uniref:fidgetin-like protein 1 isoform X2 n=1 Tax=Sitodiplosis mosellana TaxID=263140 RepID=UPI0024452343|nr:fidgetin-like protein 1 isoform X2 [Sitodiplosis mosellana]
MRRLVNIYSHRNYDDYTTCKILSDDLTEYVKESAPVHVKKCEEMMKKLNIQIEPGSVRSSLNIPNPEELLKSKKCEGVCKNDVLLDDLDKFFNLMKKRPTLTVNKPPPKFNSGEPVRSVKMQVDESGDLVFDMNFKRKKALDQNTPNNQQFQAPSTSGNQWSSHNVRATDYQASSLPNYQPNNFKPAETVTSNAFNPYGGVKRRTDDTGGNNFFKRPPNLPNRGQERNEPNAFAARNDFITANDELNIQYNKKYGGGNQNDNMTYNVNPSGGLRRSLGGRRTVTNKFVPPFANQDNYVDRSASSNETNEISGLDGIEASHPSLKNVEPKMIEAIMNEIIDQGDKVEWHCIAGLEYAKKMLQEAVVLPILRPDIFTGLRQPPRGVLLFGPPGTGKTMIGKCIASQSNSTFFSISASSLTSKWIGEGEKMVRALFAVAAAKQPSVVFIDEVDSLLCQRSESEHESSRRMKTEFLVQLDGASTMEKDRILIVGATNRPQELDEAARRRFVKRLYIPLPEYPARREILYSLLSSINHVITESQFDEIATRADGFSGADMKVLCQEAVMGPIRSISFTDMQNMSADGVRPVTFTDFLDAQKCVRASVSQDDIQQYVDWTNKYGSGSGQ